MTYFVDTNIVAYSIGRDARKRAAARDLLAARPVVSTQVVSEFLNVCRKKPSFDLEHRHRLATELMAGCHVRVIDTKTLERAMEIEERTGYSFWDSLIVATALFAGCDTLFTEDMQHGRVIDGMLTIINPFQGDVSPSLD